MPENPVGAIIESELSDWQIIQQDAAGVGTIRLGGRWIGEKPGDVEVRVVWENTSAAVTGAPDWRKARTRADGTWSAALKVPAGGLYRLETRYRPKAVTAGEWAPRGDMRHFIGVGDLWIIAGQSNSAGYGRGPVDDPPELGIHLLRNSERWALATHPMNESTDTGHAINREAANSAHSPYLQFARILKQHLGYPVGLIQTALGGSPLAMWDPSDPCGGGLFHNMIHCAKLAGGRVRGICWYQGESDAGGEAAATYAARFAGAVRAWRKALKDPTLPVITVQINRVLGAEAAPEANRDWTILRDAQRRAARDIPHVACVPTFDLGLTDAIHTSPAGNLTLGERMAAAALGMVFGRQGEWRAPDIQSAKLARGGKEIVLIFAPVTSRIETIHPTAIPFRVEDAEGDVPIASIGYCQSDRIRLVPARKLQGRAVVHGPYGTAPPVAPIDMERLTPILGFHNVPVTK